MKHCYLLMATVLLLASCSMDEKQELPPEALIGDNSNVRACFKVSQNSVMAGASLNITNCSEGARSYYFDFGNGSSSTDDQPVVFYDEAGTYELTLTVTGEGDIADSFSITIQVVGPNFIYPEIPQGYTAHPIDAGIDSQTGKFYAISQLTDEAGLEGSKFYYHALGATMMEDAHYLGDKSYDGNNAFSWELPSGARGFHFSRTLNGLYGSQEVTFDSNWNQAGQLNSADQISYGYLEDQGSMLFYGSFDDGSSNKAMIDMRNATGDSFKQVLHQVGEQDALIGSMLRTMEGYVAFGGTFLKNDSKPFISQYRPALIFMNEAMEVLNYIIYDSTSLTDKIFSTSDLNGSFSMVQLANGNLVLYGLGELLVTTPGGAIIRSHFYENTLNNQALVGLRDHFIISSDRFLRKFNAQGEQLKSLQYPGKQMPAFISKNEKLFLVAQYATPEGKQLLYGTMDTELNILAWEPG